MSDSPRPDDLGEQRTPVAPEPQEDTPEAADPRSEPGVRGALASVPYWVVVLVVIIAALVFLLLADQLVVTQ